MLWVPTIQSGASYNHPEGNLQDSEGNILDVSRSSLQAGPGAGAVGADTTMQPGIFAQFRLVDALFQSTIAERNVWAQQHANAAVLNDQLLEAAVAYQELLRVGGRVSRKIWPVFRLRGLIDTTKRKPSDSTYD